MAREILRHEEHGGAALVQYIDEEPPTLPIITEDKINDTNTSKPSNPQSADADQRNDAGQ